MKKTPKIVLAALLSMVLSVSAGCAAPGTPSLDRMEQTETAEQQYDEEERVVVRQLALAAEEQQNSDKLIDTSNLDMKKLGSMNMGGGKGDFANKFDRRNKTE